MMGAVAVAGVTAAAAVGMAAHAQSAPSLPAVPRETPENTGPLISPATPGLNLDAPPPETPGVGPLPAPGTILPTPQTLEPPPTPLDERNALVFEGPVDEATLDSERRWRFAGDVRVRYRGYRIRADRVTYDERSRVAVFEGDVEIEAEGQQSFGDRLSLDLRTREFRDFSLRGGRAVVPPERVGPNLLLPLRLSGASLERIGRDLVAEEGFLTTCDFPDPHYKIGFRKATLLPNRRLALRDATLYQRDRKLLRIRYLAIPISDRTMRSNYLPEVGRTDEEGYYVKTALGYLISEALPGTLNLDLMQKKGVRFGIDQSYALGAAAAGTLLLSSLRDQNRGVQNLSGRLNHQQRLPLGIRATVASDFQQNSYQSLTTNSKTQLTTITFAREANRLSSNLGLSFSSNDYGQGASSTRTTTFSQSAPLGPTGNLTFRYNGSRFRTPAQGTFPGSSRDDQTADVQARTRVGVFDLDVSANKNLSGGSGSGGYFSGTERLPEFTLTTDTLRLAPRRWPKSLPLRLLTGYGTFIENGLGSTERRSTSRALLGVDADNLAPIPLAGRLSLQVGGSLRQSLYSDNTAQYVLAGRSQITQKLGGPSTFSLTYGYLRPYGFTPLTSDRSGSFHNAGANLSVDTPRLRLTVFTGYDIQRALQDNLPAGFQRNPWQSLAVQLALRPSGAFQTRFTSSYDINSGRLRDLTNRVRVRVPGSLALDTGLRYDPASGKLAQANAALETSLFGGLYNLSALAGYNGFTRRFEYKNFALTRSWHDYELTITYVDQPYGSVRSDKGFNLMFRLKAFPVFQRTGVGQYGTALSTGTGEVF